MWGKGLKTRMMWLNCWAHIFFWEEGEKENNAFSHEGWASTWCLSRRKCHVRPCRKEKKDGGEKGRSSTETKRENWFSSILLCMRRGIEEYWSKRWAVDRRLLRAFSLGLFLSTYRAFITEILSELSSRFSAHSKLISHLTYLYPSLVSTSTFNMLRPLLDLVGPDLPSNDMTLLEAEFDLYKHYWRSQQGGYPSTAKDILISLSSKRNMFPNIVPLLELYATFPVTVAEAERSFSVMKLIKTHLRNRTGDSRLSSLALIHVHKNIAEQMNPEEIVEELGRKNRRFKASPLQNRFSTWCMESPWNFLQISDSKVQMWKKFHGSSPFCSGDLQVPRGKMGVPRVQGFFQYTSGWSARVGLIRKRTPWCFRWGRGFFLILREGP